MPSKTFVIWYLVYPLIIKISELSIKLTTIFSFIAYIILLPEGCRIIKEMFEIKINAVSFDLTNPTVILNRYPPSCYVTEFPACLILMSIWNLNFINSL